MLFQVIPKGACRIKGLGEKTQNLKAQKYNHLPTVDLLAHEREGSPGGVARLTGERCWKTEDATLQSFP